MDGASLARIRWRLRGAWMWPLFLALTVVDAIIGHLLPPSGEGQGIPSATVVGLFLNLVGIVVLAWPVSLVIRHYRPDMPRLVARDYGGATVIAGITAVLLGLGLLHHSSIDSEHRARAEAVARARAYVGDRAPAEYRRNILHVSSYEIEAGRIYRECVPSATRRRTYCVIVRTQLPWDRSVTFAGYESNSTLAKGAW